jgi:hypothetical protein
MSIQTTYLVAIDGVLPKKLVEARLVYLLNQKMQQILRKIRLFSL